MDLDERRRVADANLLAAFSMTSAGLNEPKGGVTRFGSVDVVAVGVESAFFNPVLVLEPGARPNDVVAGIDWVEARGLPVSVQVRDDIDPDLRSTLEGLGLVADPWPTPVMVLDPIGSAPPTPDSMDIRIGGPELFDDWHAALESGELFRRIFDRSLVADPRIRLAVGYDEDEPVSAAAAIQSGSTLGIYAVGTVDRARRRGFGRAATWAAIDAGRRAWRSTVAILQSSEAGVPLYRSMGFEMVAAYIEYARPKG